METNREIHIIIYIYMYTERENDKENREQKQILGKRNKRYEMGERGDIERMDVAGKWGGTRELRGEMREGNMKEGMGMVYKNLPTSHHHPQRPPHILNPNPLQRNQMLPLKRYAFSIMRILGEFLILGLS